MRGFRRQGTQVHLVAPAGEDAPLGAVDPAGVVGEDRLQGVGHTLVGGAQGRRSGRRAGDLRVSGGGGHGRVSGGGVMGGSVAAVVMGESPAAGFRGDSAV